MIYRLQRGNRPFPDGNASGVLLQFQANPRDGSCKPSEAIETGRILTPGLHEIAYAGDAERQTTVVACIGMLTTIMPANLVEHLLGNQQGLANSAGEPLPPDLSARCRESRDWNRYGDPRRVGWRVQSGTGQNRRSNFIGK
jgi:hypothetical protein